MVVHRAVEIDSDDFDIFPDPYVKAKMINHKQKWVRTDTHMNCVDNIALFNYRLVPERFCHPRQPTRMQAWRGKEASSILKVVLMEEDRITPDDLIGTLELDLTSVPAPDNQANCSHLTLDNNRINMFAMTAPYVAEGTFSEGDP